MRDDFAVDFDGACHDGQSAGHVLQQFVSPLAPRKRIVGQGHQANVKGLQMTYFGFQCPVHACNLQIGYVEVARANQAQFQIGILLREIGQWVSYQVQVSRCPLASDPSQYDLFADRGLGTVVFFRGI